MFLEELAVNAGAGTNIKPMHPGLHPKAEESAACKDNLHVWLKQK